jgi:hypothetical protein
LRCDSVLNTPDRVKGNVPDLKIVANNPDATLTATAQVGQGLRVPGVYVLNMRGEPLGNQEPYQKHRAKSY